MVVLCAATVASARTLCGDQTTDLSIKASEQPMLTCQYFVKSGATLTIEAGTTIEALQSSTDGSGTAPALVIEAGAKIFAEGTSDFPITFTANGTEAQLNKYVPTAAAATHPTQEIADSPNPVFS